MGIILALAVSEYVQTPSAVGYGFGGSVLTAGLYLVPGGLMAAAGGAVAAPVLSRFGQRATALAGGLLATVSFLWFQSTASRPWEFVVLTALSGVSYALVYTAGSSAYLRAARPGEAGMLAGGARVTSTAIAATGPVVVGIAPHQFARAAYDGPSTRQLRARVDLPRVLWSSDLCDRCIRTRIMPRPATGRPRRDRVIARRE